jgi:hypothetical protein
MSRVVDCEPLHLHLVASRLPRRDVEEILALGYRSVQDVAAQRAVEHGVRWTILDSDGMPQVCFGVSETRVPGVGLLWMLRAEGAERFVKTGTKALRVIVKSREYRRIEAQARADCHPCRSFLEWLGFTYEGTKRSFFLDGADLDEFALVKGV